MMSNGAASFRETVMLAIETAGSRCSAAVVHGRKIVATESQPLRYGHGEALMPLVSRVVAAAAVLPDSLGIVAVTTGPGGFTGIRVGLAAARGIALATGARLIGVTGFAAVAYAVRQAPMIERANLLVVLDTRRDDLYVQLFAPNLIPRAAPRAVPPDRLGDYVAAISGPARLLVAGDATAAAAAALGVRLAYDLIPNSAPDAIGVAAAAAEATQTRAVPVRPLYLRPPDVTLPKPRLSRAARP